MSASRGTSSWALLGASFTERATLCTLTAALLTSAYWIYAFTVAPLVKGPPIHTRQSTFNTQLPVATTSAGRAMAERYLAHQPWASDAWYQVRTPHAYVYFQSWATVEGNDKAVRFKPFAVTWLPTGKNKDEPPITISSESAYVTFASKFDISKVATLRLNSGGLEGDVLITGPNGLYATGKDFTFAEDAMRLWSDSPIEFAFEKHRGRARGLQIELIRGEQGDDATRPAVQGIKSIRLLRDVVMDLMSEPRDKPEDGETRSLKPRKPKEPDLVKIRSAGSFEFVLATNIGTFEENVQIDRPNAKGEYDRLFSDELVIFTFEKKQDPNAPGALADADDKQSSPSGAAKTKVVQTSAASTPELDPDDSKRSVDSNLAFRKLHARGKKVFVSSDPNKFEGHMTDLQYDGLTRNASMTNPLKSSFRTTSPVVVLKQDTTVMRCPEINFHHDKKGSILTVTCRGAGSLDRYSDESVESSSSRGGQPRNLSVEFSAEWKKELRKFPDKESPYDIVELEGQSLIQQPEGEKHWGLAAEFIRVWMDPMRRETKPTIPNDKLSQKSKTPRLRFAKATRNVAFYNADMESQTEKLEVWFEDRPAAARDTVGSISQPSRRTLQLTAGRELKPRTREFQLAEPQPAGAARGTAVSKTRLAGQQAFASTRDQPRKSSGGVRPAETAAPLSPAKSMDLMGGKPASQDGPIRVDADLIQVRVLQGANSKDTEVAEIWTKGNVRVKQEHGDGKEPLRMFGEQMHVANRTKENKVLRIFGKPAHIQNQGVHIEGNEVQLDQAANEAMVQGAGRLQLPVTQSFDGKPLATPMPLDILWQEKMAFDGLTARFFRQVKGTMNDDRMKNEMRCQEMTVVMTEKILFSGSQKRNDVRVRHVQCEGHVEFDSDEMQGEKIVDMRRVNAARFAVDQTTGKTEAQGPGIISRWQFGKERPQGLGPLSNVRANSPAKPDTSEWTYTRVTFAGKMVGNMNQRSSTFHDDVNILYGPVADKMQTIDRDHLGDNAGWMGCESLTVIQHPETPTSPSYAELQARKNARLEGKKYNGQADSISYDGSKGQFMLRAEGNGTATIWTQEQVGGESTPNQARQIEFNPRTNALKLNEVSGLNWVQ